MTRIIGFTLLMTFSVAAGAAGVPTVADARVQPDPPSAGTAAAYLTIQGADEADRLIGARSTVAGRIYIHMVMKMNGASATHMMPIASIDVPAHGTVTLAPDANHLMLTELTRPLVSGESVVITLMFEHAGAVDVTFPVKDARSDDHARQQSDHNGQH